MNEDDDGGIIHVEFGRTQTSLHVKKGDRRCSHAQVEVAEFSRTVECRACGALLDPLTVLLEYAKRERAFENIGRARDELARKVHELKAEERRLKQRIRRAKERADPQLALL